MVIGKPRVAVDDQHAERGRFPADQRATSSPLSGFDAEAPRAEFSCPLMLDQLGPPCDATSSWKSSLAT
jgi:hypothetical protein